MKKLCTKCRRVEVKHGRAWCTECLLKEYKTMPEETLPEVPTTETEEATEVDGTEPAVE